MICKVINGVEYWGNCKCTIEKINRQRIENSGLSEVLEKCTLDTYETNYDWQRTIKNTALEYIKNPERWFFIGGETGSGKSHICTAMCGELMKQGKSVRYMPWLSENTRLKACRNDDEKYDFRIEPWKNAEVLYIDDFFKTKDDVPVSGADVITAYEILNYRYMKKNSITIISTQLSCEEILDIDTAVAGRIIEMANDHIIVLRGEDKNQRLNRRTK